MSDAAQLTWNVEDLPAALQPLREEILAELVMLSQIPSPAGEEAVRVRHLLGPLCGSRFAGSRDR